MYFYFCFILIFFYIQGAVAKKPYNPILGEVFRCYWPIPKGEHKAPNENALQLQKTGPIPYSTYDSVTFVAEQVSHHPPSKNLVP